METPTIVPLVSRSDALDTVARWIDSEWGAFSGRSLAQTRERFAGEVPGGLPATLVAIRHGRVVGAASLRERDSCDWDSEATPWICNVFVERDARGAGIAARLCLRLEKEARRLGFARTFLASLRPQGSLYQRIGYRTYRSVPLGNGRMFLMQKQLVGAKNG